MGLVLARLWRTLTHLPFEGPHAVGVNHQITITSTSYIWANLCPHSEANQFRELHRSISATELLWCNTDLQSSRDKCFLASYLHNSGVWVHCVIHPSLIISRGMLYRIYGCKSAYTRCEFHLQPWFNHSRSLPNSSAPLKTCKPPRDLSTTGILKERNEGKELEGC